MEKITIELTENEIARIIRALDSRAIEWDIEGLRADSNDEAKKCRSIAEKYNELTQKFKAL